jgi:hypothetical protein
VFRAKAALGQDLDVATNHNEPDGANTFVFGTGDGDSSHRVVHDSETEVKRVGPYSVGASCSVGD